MRNILGHAVKKSEQSEEMIIYARIIKKLLGEDCLDLLLDKLEIVNNKIMMPQDESITNILNEINEKLSLDSLQPHLIWNSNMRIELMKILKDQIAFIISSKSVTKENFATILTNFQYTAIKQEIAVGDVLITVLNKNPKIKLKKPNVFLLAALQEIEKMDLKKLESDADLLKLANEIMDAFTNTLIYQKGIDYKAIIDNMLKVLGKIINPNLTSIPQFMENIYNRIFEIFLEIGKETDQLLLNSNFILIAFTSLCNRQSTYLMNKIIACLDASVGYNESQDSVIKKGYAIALFDIAFDTTVEKATRIKAIGLIQSLLIKGKLQGKAQVFSYYVPAELLRRMADQNEIHPDEWFKYIESENADAYLILDKELKNKIQEILNNEVKKFQKALLKNSEANWVIIPQENSIESYVNKGEIVVADLILTSFIKHPILKIRVNLYVFIKFS